MLLKNCTLVSLFPGMVEQADLRVENGIIVERKKRLSAKRNEEVVSFEGKYVLPGFVNAHTHLYSSLARGMGAPKKSPGNFLEILQYVWWKLDRALDDETIYYSALAGAIEAVQCGTTTLVDHHASPKAIPGSLDLIKLAMEEVGLRGVLCYEVTDRGGMKERNAGLDENERFINAHKESVMFRGMVGGHASFTLGNESLKLLGEMAERTDTGVHIHVAEDRCDVVDARESYRSGVLERLDTHRIVRDDSILAHCIHLEMPEIQRVQKVGAWFAHNPRSNMNNFVGHAPVHLLGNRVALGTDGFPADMFEEARSGFFKNSDMRYAERSAESNGKNSGKKIQDVSFTKLLQGGQELVSEKFGLEFGTLQKGSAADIVVLDYQAPTPVTDANVGGHFLFGMRSAMVDSVMINGKWILWNRVFPGLDTEHIMKKAARAAEKLWKRI